MRACVRRQTFVLPTGSMTVHCLCCCEEDCTGATCGKKHCKKQCHRWENCAWGQPFRPLGPYGRRLKCLLEEAKAAAEAKEDVVRRQEQHGANCGESGGATRKHLPDATFAFAPCSCANCDRANAGDCVTCGSSLSERSFEDCPRCRKRTAFCHTDNRGRHCSHCSKVRIDSGSASDTGDDDDEAPGANDHCPCARCDKRWGSIADDDTACPRCLLQNSGHKYAFCDQACDQVTRHCITALGGWYCVHGCDGHPI